MSKPKSGEIRQFIIDTLEGHPRDIARVTAEHFGITRQAVHRHLTNLVEDELIEARGKTREREYLLRRKSIAVELPLVDNRDEDRVWRVHLAPHLASLRDNVLRICHYGFTEMFNNVIDHSEGTTARVDLILDAKTVNINVEDDGVGIFEKIRKTFGLEDHRHAILELSKGKLTSDPRRHTGQGIFFTSRMFDRFIIHSGGLSFLHKTGSDDWLIESHLRNEPGTEVGLSIARDATQTPREIFDRYADLDSDDYDFSRTHVPLQLAKYGKEGLVSRSQAKRVLARFDKFKEVLLDFSRIDSIGQAFADEIFRVFHEQNPGIEILAIHANEDVKRMIVRAIAARDPS